MLFLFPSFMSQHLYVRYLRFAAFHSRLEMCVYYQKKKTLKWGTAYEKAVRSWWTEFVCSENSYD